jgi:hypothetical protein
MSMGTGSLDAMQRSAMRHALAGAVLGAMSLAPMDALAEDKAACLAASDSAQDLRDDGHYRRAREALTVCARDVCPAVVRRDCVQWLADLDESAPTVVFDARDTSGNDLTAVRVSFDGEAVSTALDGRPVLLDPGSHMVRYEAAGWSPIEQRVVLRVGEKNRILVARFDSRVDGPSRVFHGVPPASWVLAGVAALSFASEAYFGITGLDDRSRAMSQSCAPHCAPSDVDAIRTKFVAADVSLGVGVVSLASALYLWLSASREHAADKGTAIVDIQGAPTGFVWRLRAEF